MPVTDQRITTSWSGSYTNGTSVYKMGTSQIRMAGFYKSISNLNDRGPWPSKEYCCNSVTIQQYFAVAPEVEFPSTERGAYTYQASGQMGAALSVSVIPAGTLPAIPVWDEGRAKEALNRAYAKLAQPELDLGVMLGELPETLRGLRNPLSALRKAIKDFRKFRLLKEANDHEMLISEKGKRGPGKRAKAAMNRRYRRALKRQMLATADGATGSLLELRYGIMPLIGSVQDVIAYVNAAIKRYHEKLRRKRARAAMTEKKVIYSKRDTVLGTYYIDYDLVAETQDQYNGSVSYRCTRPPRLDEILGFDFLSLPSIAWELTTLSFVFDWFISVGKWLDALKSIFSSRFEILGCSVSRKTTVSYTGRISKVRVYTTPVAYTSQGPEFESALVSLTRKCYPPQGFTDVMPRVNSGALSLLQQLDSLALVWQRASKLLR